MSLTPFSSSLQPTPGFPTVSEPKRQTGVFWSSTASNADYKFDGTNLTATRATVVGGNGAQARANAAASSGYWEGKNVTGGNPIGFAPVGAATNNWIGFVTNTIGYHSGGAIWRNNVNVATYASYTNNDTLMAALKLVGATLYAFFGVNGIWQAGTSPSTGVGGIDVTALFSSAVPSFSANGAGEGCTGAFTASALKYPIPSGLTAWDGTTLLLSAVGLSVVAIQFADTAALARLRGFVSSNAVTFTETATSFARLRGVVSAVAATWADTAILSRVQGFVSSCAEVWAESSTLARLRGLVGSASAVFTEASTISRLKALISSVAAAFAETSTLARLRGFVAAAAETWAETAALARLRAIIAAATQTWAETGQLARLRGLAGAGTASWTETALLARLRGCNAAGTAQWAEVSAIVRKRQLAGTNGSIWNGLAKFTGTGLTSAAVFAFAGAAQLSRKRNFVSATVAQFSETSLLSTSTVFIPHGPTLRFTREQQPFPRAAREDRRRIF